MTLHKRIWRAALCGIGAFVAAGAARAETPAPADKDAVELSAHFGKVDVWSFQVDYDIGYNNQDAIVTRELIAKPTPEGKLCYVRFDLLRGEGAYSYGFRPEKLGGTGKTTEWGVWVKKIGDVLSQRRSVLKMNVIYFYVDAPKDAAAETLCAQKQAAKTPQAGWGYTAPEWSDLVVRAKLVHGWPAAEAQ
jgi:hypothetical protein